MKTRHVLILLVIALMLALFSAVPKITLAVVTSNVTVDVNITSFTQINVLPIVLNWTSAPVGNAGGAKNLSIKNTGSVNVTNIYINSNTVAVESTRPYGSSNPQSYAATGVLFVRNNTNITDTAIVKFPIDRLEWNETAEIANIVKTNVANPRASGFFRNTSAEFVWVVGNGSSGGSEIQCNNTDAQFAIEDDADDGSAATRTPTTTGITYNGGDSNWGYFSVNRETSILNGTCVAVNRTCDKILVYKYDVGGNFSTCTNAIYMRAYYLVPNEIYTIDVNAYVPRGVPQGSMKTGQLTISAS